MVTKQNLVGRIVLTYWQVDEFIGSGGYGNVYKAHRNIGKEITYAAIKHIVIPEPEQYKERLISNRNNVDQTDKYFKKLYEDILTEITTMDKLTGKSVNIVAYRNHEVIEHHDPKRYEIIIEMEYLKPFSTYCIEKNMTVGEVLKMGMEIASALDVCHSKDIMHRDIKESNIFVDSDGNFKLGDFGLAKILTESSKAKSDAGTAAYKAPEIAIPFSEYRKTVDIYSLGIVLYRMFNNGRIPFLPSYPEEYDYDDETSALGRRLRCEALPRPRCATKEIAEVILKACAPKPEDRYQTAAEMRMAIKLLINELSKEEIEKPVDLLPGEYTRMNASNMFNESFGKSMNRDENYVHENIFGSTDGRPHKDNTSLDEKDRLLLEAAKKDRTEKDVWGYTNSDNKVKAYKDEEASTIKTKYVIIAAAILIVIGIVIILSNQNMKNGTMVENNEQTTGQTQQSSVTVTETEPVVQQQTESQQQTAQLITQQSQVNNTKPAYSTQPALNTEEIVKDIREKYNYINNNVNSFRKVTINGCQMYVEGSELKKAVIGSGEQATEYYFWDNDIFFAFIMDYNNNSGGPVTTRLYFSGQKLIRLLVKYQIDEDNSEIVTDNPIYSEYEEMIINNSAYILNEFRRGY